MIKFLRMQCGYLLNVNNVKEIVPVVNLNRWEGAKRGIKAAIEIQTTTGERSTFIDIFESAPLKEGEQWGYGTKGKRAVERVKDILDTMITVLVDKMNEKDEKIISIGTSFLEEAMQEEVDRG